MENLKENSQLFFVVETVDGNEEIFTHYGSAVEYHESLLDREKPVLYIGLVNNAYREERQHWNYEDLSDTFTKIKVLEQ